MGHHPVGLCFSWMTPFKTHRRYELVSQICTFRCRTFLSILSRITSCFYWLDLLGNHSIRGIFLYSRDIFVDSTTSILHFHANLAWNHSWNISHSELHPGHTMAPMANGPQPRPMTPQPFSGDLHSFRVTEHPQVFSLSASCQVRSNWNGSRWGSFTPCGHTIFRCLNMINVPFGTSSIYRKPQCLWGWNTTWFRVVHEW